MRTPGTACRLELPCCARLKHCRRTGLLLLLLWASCSRFDAIQDAASHVQETIETIVYLDPAGVEHEEYAFREPARGLPVHVMDMFCSSVKLRLYWNGFRDEIKDDKRKGIYLRRMARLARHIFKDIRGADRPFNATMLSRTDDYFAVKLDTGDEEVDRAISSRADEAEGAEPHRGATNQTDPLSAGARQFRKLKLLSRRISHKLSHKWSGDINNVMEEIDSSDTMKRLESEGQLDARLKIKRFARKWGPKVALAIYTRWRTMWWMMMSCLYTKFYLWDPALDEFLKLKRSLVMWPELQLARMQDLNCPPLMFFVRLMDVCKVLNPLMNINFGQFNLDKLTRFKTDT